LIRNANRQDTSVSAPPTMSPITDPTPVIAAKMAVAALRAGPLGNVVATSASAVGDAMAEPTPCARRAITKVVSSHASPHRIDAMANSATPAMNVRLRPMVSPSRPPSSISPPNVSTYAVITQLRPASDRFSSFWILGRATIATVLSIVARSCMPPIATTAAVKRLEGSHAGRDQPVRFVTSRAARLARTRAARPWGATAVRSAPLRAVMCGYLTVLLAFL
jgi:hypothetical protein